MSKITGNGYLVNIVLKAKTLEHAKQEVNEIASNYDDVRIFEVENDKFINVHRILQSSDKIREESEDEKSLVINEDTIN